MINNKQVLKLLEDKKLIRSKELTSIGMDRKAILRMVDSGELRKIAYGLYCSPDYIPGPYHSLIEAQKLVDKGVICLTSALSYYEIGVQNPSLVWMAIPRNSWITERQDIPVRIVKFSGNAYEEGIVDRDMDGVSVKIYSIAKTLADCFKYRNKIGMETVIEALQLVVQNNMATIDEILYYADICRVRNVMKPYLESIL
ncbi:type IV toxin-antitoxin system AbiEi family antitoxin domain-containing protein [Spirochaeta isovalerica]|uniref:Putative transcriptional regulator of viral defense system n=1 Tax=Spirochaeta isovalerica TaxID=150 RepID=A0A841RGF7_9SPIO|nr:type IV toxin-antitoxin system AbiEi family antitoxin domain-containing protein [Spirochaeta isovalerica]MBB6481869.1 putative transcriptional regulator of viral defense system [Spirochaeta isovalerica]